MPLDTLLLRFGLFAASVSLLAPRLPAAETAVRPPNIVLIMADDLGWKDLHCYGNPALDTPALDQLAAEGMRFTDAYAASPVCSPTRAAIMTGQAPARLGLTNHAPGNKDGFALEDSPIREPETLRHLPLSAVTLAERLADCGYVNAHIGKWHLSYVAPGNQSITEPELRPDRQGFAINIGGCFRGGPPSYFAPYRIPTLEPKQPGEYLPERLADEAIAFIQEHRDEAFFLNWWPYSVHYPMQAREELIAKYRGRAGPGIRNPVYAAMIEAMDTEIGRFLRALDAADLRGNTLVIFKSDNGGYDGDNRPLRGFKGMLYEGGIRIPWIVRWPGHVAPGTTCSTPVISTDCYPTLLEVAGLPLPPETPSDGESLVPLFRQTGELQRSDLCFHYPNYAFHKKNRLGSAIRRGPFKLIRRDRDGSVELYDLSQDIGETTNIALQQPELTRQLTARLEEWLQSTGARLPVRNTAD